MTDREKYFEYLRGRRLAGYLYRRLWLYPRLSTRLPGRVLDVGCGLGDFLRYRKNTVGVDVNPHAVAWCRRRGLDAREMDADRIPFADGCFEAAMLDNVLEHILRPEPLLAEIRRVVVVGGALIVGVPGRKGFAADPDHKRFHDEAGLIRLLDMNGFDCKSVLHLPFRCRAMEKRLRQYCIYGVFRSR